MGERRLQGKPRRAVHVDDKTVEELIQRGSSDPETRSASLPRAAREPVLHRRKIQIIVNIPPDLLEKLDAYLDSQGLHRQRSAWIVERIRETLD